MADLNYKSDDAYSSIDRVAQKLLFRRDFLAIVYGKINAIININVRLLFSVKFAVG